MSLRLVAVVGLTIFLLIIFFIALNACLAATVKSEVFNQWLCEKEPHSIPCSIHNYDKCATMTYKIQNDFNAQNAINLGNLYSAFYEGNKSKLLPNYTILGTHSYKFKKDTSPVCNIAKIPGTGIGFIILRGTNKFLNEWMLDAQYSQRPFPYAPKDKGILSNNGFIQGYKQFRDDMMRVINAQTDVTHWFAVGHSLGSALTALMTADFVGNGPPWATISCYCFGPPRAGNKAFVKYIEDSPRVISYNSIINISDVVPTLPRSIMYSFIDDQFESYMHIGNKIVYDKNFNSYILNHSINEYVHTMTELKKETDCGVYVPPYSI